MTSILSVSVPDDVRAMLDAEAARQRRSRSFVVSEAVRAYVTRSEGDAFSAARDQTLREGLALTPADRVRLAEELWHELARGRPKARPWAASFDTFHEYERLRTKRDRAGPAAGSRAK